MRHPHTTDALAVSALERYGVRDRSVRPLARDVRRVQAEDGQKYALRLRPISDRVFGDIPLELAWMDALRRDTELEPPEAVPGLDGKPLQEVDGHDCLLFRWIPGVELEQRLSAENVRKLGVLSACLHEHAATYRPPADLPVRTLDRLVRGAERLVLFDPEHAAFVPPARHETFRAIADRYTSTVAALYADPIGRRVIHSDLHQENVKVYRGRLRPLDFYEVIWGYPVQDVALTLYDLRFFTDASPAVRDAFRVGYEARLPWPEQHPRQIETLIAGRRLRTANYRLFQLQPPALLAFFEQLEAEFRTLLEVAA